jgi:glycosyltransferase involved in cell wall biosynthesis
MKIIYIIDTLASKGGAERIITNKMDYMASFWGYEISIITCYQNSNTPNAYILSEKINQIYLDIPFYSQYKYKYPYRLYVKNNINKRLIKRLSETISELDPDIIIGVGYFNADIICKIKCRAKKIIEVHEPRPFTLADPGLKRSLLSKVYMKIYRQRYFRSVEKEADVVVTLTKGDAQEWKKAKRIATIPNFTVMRSNDSYNENHKRIIAVGRLEWVKGYDRLLKIWELVSQKHKDWILDIFGSGSLEETLNLNIKALKLKNIKIHQFKSNIEDEYSNCSILLSTSYYEGFSLALIEAMQFGIPCIAFDCPFGPRDVIDDEKNGFVIKDGDIINFAKRLDMLIENPQLRKEFSNAAKLKVKQYDINIVMQKWKELFEKTICL